MISFKFHSYRRLAQIRKTQPNLRTQLRLGKEDFAIFGKYLNPDNPAKKEAFEELPLNFIDPNKDLSEVNCTEKKKNNNKEKILRKAFNEMKKMNAEKDAEGYETVTGKRKNSSPQERRMKRNRQFTPEKAGEKFFRRIKLREMENETDEDSTDDELSSETSESEEEKNNGTVIMNQEEKEQNEAVRAINDEGEVPLSI